MSQIIKLLCIYLLLCSVIVCRYLLQVTHYWHLPQNEILKPVQIAGVIVSVPEKKFHGLRFLFQVSRFQNHLVSTKMLVSWYHHPPALSVGQHWRLTVKLKPPVGLHNPGGFDYAAWLKRHGIYATGYVVTSSSQKLLGKAYGHWLLHLRMRVEKAISLAVPDHTMAAVLSALSVGLRDELQPADWQVFQRTGTSHLVAISGLHIGLVASAVLILFQLLWRQIPRLLLYCPAVRAGQIASIFAAFIYTALSGFALPAQRALVMIICFMLSEIFCYQLPFYKRLLFALLVVIFITPQSICSASFSLSFFAVIILGYLLCGRLRVACGLFGWGRVQSALCIGLMPITLWYFHQVSTVSMLANAIAIPWISFVVVPSVLVGVLVFMFGGLFISQWCFRLSGLLLKPLWWFLHILSDNAWSFWQHTLYSPWILCCALAGVFIVLSPKGIPAKWLGCVGFLPLFFYHPKPPKFGDFWVMVLDVGQGLSVIVKTQKHTLIYDTGLHIPQGFDAGQAVVLPFLQRAGISTIDRMVISHGDNDHSGGAASIVTTMPVQSVLTSAPKFKKMFHGKFCHAGQFWQWDGVKFQVLSPWPQADYQDNNSSCVLRISNGDNSILLTGDIERSQEMQLVSRVKKQLAATVLVVPHHGSRTSSSWEFIKAVSPHYAVISLGAYNRYHFPSPSVIQRFDTLGIKVYTTAKNGAIRVRFL